jgi:hypothetical protein
MRRLNTRSPSLLKEHDMRIRYALAIAAAAALLAPTSLVVSAQTPAPALKKMAPPLKGQIDIGYMMAPMKREGDKLVQTIQIKNLSATGSIVGLQVEEYFYDKTGNPLQGTGDLQRIKQPVQPGEVISVTLTSNTAPGMTSPQYKFTYRDGKITPKALKTLK